MSVTSSASSVLDMFSTEQGNRVVCILFDLATQAHDTLEGVATTKQQWAAGLATLKIDSPSAMDEAALRETIASIQRRCPDFSELLRESVGAYAQRRFQAARGPVRVRVPTVTRLLRLFYDQLADCQVLKRQQWHRYDYFQQQKIVRDIAKATFELSLLGNVTMTPAITDDVLPSDSVSSVGVIPPLTTAAVEAHMRSAGGSEAASRAPSVVDSIISAAKETASEARAPSVVSKSASRAPSVVSRSGGSVVSAARAPSVVSRSGGSGGSVVSAVSAARRAPVPEMVEFSDSGPGEKPTAGIDAESDSTLKPTETSQPARRRGPVAKIRLSTPRRAMSEVGSAASFWSSQ